MTLQVNTAPLSRELIRTLPPVSDTDIFEKYVVPGMAADEQLVGGQVVDRTQADPKGKWRLFGYDPRTDRNPFDVRAEDGHAEIDSHYCTALVEKGSTTLYKRGPVTGVWGLVIDDIDEPALKALRPHHPHPTLIIPTSDFSTPQWLFLFLEILRDRDRHANMIRTLRAELNGLVRAGKPPWGDPSAATKYKNCRGSGSINTKPGRNNYQAQWYDTGEVHDVRKIELDLLGMTPATHIDFGARLNGATPTPTKAKGGRRGANGTEPEDRVREALGFLDPSMGYTPWLQVGMALHDWDRDRGYHLWEQWSQGGSNYEQGATARAWRSFKPGKTTIASLFHMAKEAGWDAKASHRKQAAADYDTQAALMKTIEAAIKEASNQRELDELTSIIRQAKLNSINRNIVADRMQKRLKTLTGVKPKIASVRNMVQAADHGNDTERLFNSDDCQRSLEEEGITLRLGIHNKAVYKQEAGDTWPVRVDPAIDKNLKDRLERKHDLRFPREFWDQWTGVIAGRNLYDGLWEYLDGLQPPPEGTNKDMLELWAHEYWGGGKTPYDRFVAASFFTMPVLMTLRPGTRGRYVPTVTGPFNTGKSTFIQFILPEHLRRDFLCTALNLNQPQRDIYLDIAGRVIVDLDELDGMDKVGRKFLAKLLTIPELDFVPKHSNRQTNVPRTFCFLASANEDLTLPADLAVVTRFTIMAITKRFGVTKAKPKGIRPEDWLDDGHRDILLYMALQETKKALGLEYDEKWANGTHTYNGNIPETLKDDHKESGKANMVETDAILFKRWIEEPPKEEASNRERELKAKEKLPAPEMSELIKMFNTEKGCHLTIYKVRGPLKTMEPKWTIKPTKKWNVWVRPKQK